MIITKKQIEHGLVVFTILAILFNDLWNKLSQSSFVNFEYATYITALNAFISIFIYFRIKWRYGIFRMPLNILLIYGVWLTYLIISLVRGLYLANNYWDYKFLFLSSTSFTLIASVFFVGQNLYFARLVLNFFLKKVFLFGFLIIPLALITDSELYARLMIPIGIYLLLLPYVTKKWRNLIILVMIASIIVEITFRTNIIKIAISLAILFLYYFKGWINKGITKIIWATFFVTPILFLILALNFDYNVFEKMSSNEQYTATNAAGETESLSADTRTGLYREVIIDVSEKLQNIIFGKSPSQGHKSSLFFDSGGGMGGIRYSSEVNILNIFLYYGLVGVILFFILLARVSYLAISKSNNRLSKMLGLLIASRFLLSFIEEFTQYDINFYFFWLVLGLVSSSEFRNFSDRDIKMWLLDKTN